jgi:hypothetical protein
MFEGNVGDPSSLRNQVREAKEWFQVDRMVMITAQGRRRSAAREGVGQECVRRFLRVYPIGVIDLTTNTTITPELLDQLPAKCESPEDRTGEVVFSSRR